MRKTSMRVYLTYTIVSMGSMGLILALLTGEIYSRFLLKNQQLMMKDFVVNQTDFLMNHLLEEISDLGYSMQAEAVFKSAMSENSVSSTRNMLSKQFERHFADDGVIKLLGLAIYNNKIENPVSYFANSKASDVEICSNFISNAKNSSAQDKLKRKSGICIISGTPTFVTLLPIGVVFPKAYLFIVADLVTALAPLEKNIKSPVKLLSPNNQVLHISQQWIKNNKNALLIAQYTLKDYDHRAALTVKAAKNITVLKKNLMRTQTLISSAAILITLLTIIIAHRILTRKVVRPLSMLADQLQKVRNDRQYLGESVHVNGNKEIQILAENFNLMSLELKSLYESLEHLALTDPLTKLPNRLRMQIMLNSLINLNKTKVVPFAILIMDMNGFKNINDTLGHLAGDQVLSEVGNRLRLVSRSSDFVSRIEKSTSNEVKDDRILARIGGDEFAGIFQRIRSHAEALAVVDHLIKALSEPFLLEGCCYNLGTSIGIALYPKDGRDVETLMKHADMAMYLAKKGKLGYAFYSKEE